MRRLPFTLLLVLLFGCATVDRFNVYYVGSGTIQYYIRSQRLTGDDGHIEMDFTFRVVDDDITDSDHADGVVLTNFSLVSVSDELPTAFAFFVDGTTFDVLDAEILYRRRADQVVRYSGNITLDQMYLLLDAESEGFTFRVTTRQAQYDFDPSGAMLEGFRQVAFEVEPYRS